MKSRVCTCILSAYVVLINRVQILSSGSGHTAYDIFLQGKTI